MIDLKQLLDEWKDDCKISEMHLDETSRQAVSYTHLTLPTSDLV